ncbi:MAG TPA: EAL domain-containing protein [Patescibacteria group bacterium]|nr:EAL domain-containing protein [Patescibacteria group bacterium]
MLFNGVKDANKNNFEKDKLNPKQMSLRISIKYMLIGILWILVSDKVLLLFVNSKESLANISMVKGWIYVVITGILVYTLVNSALKRIKETEGNLYISYQKLSKTNIELAAAYDKVDESQNELLLQNEKLMQNQQILEAYEKELHYQALHDQLTGLQNRRSLIKDLSELVGSKTKGKVALLIIDIDNFKYINDTMGHFFGDQLLMKLSERLEGLIEDNCKIYRLGGDEFVILFEDFDDSITIEKLAVKLLKGCTFGFDVDYSRIFISISIGIALYPEHGDNLDALLKNADIAVYKAKETGKNRIVFFNKPMNDAISERVLLEKHLRTALDSNEFVLHYQPQLDIATNKVSGLEALIRWNSPELGFVSPLKFISIAEDTHLIIPIGEWVLKNACLFLKKLHQQGYSDMLMSVNISMLQLIQDDFANKVMEILDELKLDPKYLELEITESILMESYEAIAEKLKLLKGKGVRIALDDFGKGYSSLNYLKQLPISTLKIDKSFVDTISADDKNKSLTDLIVTIGITMGLCVVAEGVETQEQLDYLVEHKCSKIQGYFFSRPVPDEAVVDAIKEREVGAK